MPLVLIVAGLVLGVGIGLALQRYARPDLAGKPRATWVAVVAAIFAIAIIGFGWIAWTLSLVGFGDKAPPPAQ